MPSSFSSGETMATTQIPDEQWCCKVSSVASSSTTHNVIKTLACHAVSLTFCLHGRFRHRAGFLLRFRGGGKGGQVVEKRLVFEFAAIH